MDMEAHKIAETIVAVSPLGQNNFDLRSDDITTAADLMEADLRDRGLNVIRLAIGGENVALSAEEVADIVNGDRKTIIVEVEDVCQNLSHFYQTLFSGDVEGTDVNRHRNTVIVFVSNGDPQVMPDAVVGRCFTFGIALPVVA